MCAHKHHFCAHQSTKAMASDMSRIVAPLIIHSICCKSGLFCVVVVVLGVRHSRVHNYCTHMHKHIFKEAGGGRGVEGDTKYMLH